MLLSLDRELIIVFCNHISAHTFELMGVNTSPQHSLAVKWSKNMYHGPSKFNYSESLVRSDATQKGRGTCTRAVTLSSIFGVGHHIDFEAGNLGAGLGKAVPGHSPKFRHKLVVSKKYRL